jgi:hypothetical protein
VSTAILLWVVLQAAMPHVPETQMGAAAPVRIPTFTDQAPEVDYAAAEEFEFIQRLNGLSSALHDFAETYKGGQVDLKKVKALRKALNEFEKSKWFRPAKAK